MLRRTFLQSSLSLIAAAALPVPSPAQRLVAAAQAQIGVTTSYDPRYVSLSYPQGDVARSTGVCADVVVRAARDGLGMDLQQLVHEDMVKHFAAYPRVAGMHRPDSNIDHRRVINLEAYWRRAGCQVWASSGNIPGDAFPDPLAPGDCVTWLLDGRLPHVAIVSSVSPGGTSLVHNIGRGAETIDLTAFRTHRAKGHFRWPA